MADPQPALDRARAFVQQDPRRVAQVIRDWVNVKQRAAFTLSPSPLAGEGGGGGNGHGGLPFHLLGRQDAMTVGADGEAACRLSGTERTAALLLALGEQDGAAVLKHMGPKEVQKICAAMAALPGVSKHELAGVLTDFNQAVEQHTALGVGAEDSMRRMLVTAFGAGRADGLLDRILAGRSSKGLEALKWMDARAVAEVIRQEHPQIIAIILSYLDSDQAAQVLARLPERLRPDLLMRIASLDGISPAALHELDDMLDRQLAGHANLKSCAIGGVKTAALILSRMDSSLESELLEQMREQDTDLGGRIEDLMFTFADLLGIDDRDLQPLLREIASATWLAALKGADEALREKVYANLSKRAAEMLREHLQTEGPVKLADIEAAQQEILSVARRLADAGAIGLGGKDGESPAG